MDHDPRLTPARPDLAAAHLKGKIDAERFVEGRPMQVTCPVLDLLDRATPTSSLGSQLLWGERFVVYDQDSTTGLAWGQSETDGYVGYVPMDGLGPADIPATHWVVTMTAQLYPAPRLKTRPRATLPFLARLTVTDMDQGYARVGPDTFVHKNQIAPIGPLDPDPVTLAELFLGCPYLWGGRSIHGLDCSALVQLAWTAAGHDLLRDTDMQEQNGILVDDPLRRGDLIFWKGHVGIMQDGDRLLHANAHHMAVTSEPLAETEARIARTEGPVTSRRRQAISP